MTLHKSLADYLFEPSTDERFRASAGDGHTRLALFLAQPVVAAAAAQAEILTSGSDGSSTMAAGRRQREHVQFEAYTTKYLVKHLVEACKAAAGHGGSSPDFAASVQGQGDGGTNAELDKGPAAANVAPIILDAVLGCFNYLDALFRAGAVPRTIADLAAGVSSASAHVVLNPFATDAFRWLQWSQHELSGSPGSSLAKALMAPVESLMCQHAGRVFVAAAGGNGKAMVCVKVLPVSDGQWKQHRHTLTVRCI